MDGSARELGRHLDETALTYDPGFSSARSTLCPSSFLSLANGYVENGSDSSGYLQPPNLPQTAASVYWTSRSVPTYTSGAAAVSYSFQELDASEVLASSIPGIVNDSASQFSAYHHDTSPADTFYPSSLGNGHVAYEDNSVRYQESPYLTQNYPTNSGYPGDGNGTGLSPDATHPGFIYASGNIEVGSTSDTVGYTPGASVHPIISGYPSVDNSTGSTANTGAYPPQIEISLAQRAPTSTHTTPPPSRCPECNKDLGSPGILKRHLKTVTAHKSETTLVYLCFCGKADTRKENHLRHLKPCRRTLIGQAICTCGRLSCHREDHVAHVKGCNRQRRRRQSISS
ncbi:hypothetical protein RRF57_008823 [Xylaria bambusicola]|uniref:C2H2-type domain-containing protein n=1 Tax=Xylaria bambusicola TaxID=326684 RepID=A0AAN7V234_9PEZI